MKNPQVVLIFGGPSDEHEVSLVSAKNISEALESLFPHHRRVGISRSGQWKEISSEELMGTSFKCPIDLEIIGTPFSLEQEASSIDVAFPICHGPFGEDGRLQQLLEDLQISYVGSRPTSCRTCLDKALTKKNIATTALQQTPYLVSGDSELRFAEVSRSLKLPFFVKPASMGSSVGISKVVAEDQWSKALALAFQYDSKIVVEQGFIGQEVECAILESDSGLRVSHITEIISHHEFYSYEAKYMDPNGAEFIYPARISETIADEIKSAAALAFRALDCRDYARADFFVNDEGHVLFNEINTHPGFTSISQFPTLWKHLGISYSQLVGQMISRAVNR